MQCGIFWPLHDVFNGSQGYQGLCRPVFENSDVLAIDSNCRKLSDVKITRPSNSWIWFDR
jgi:hypothetical protein